MKKKLLIVAHPNMGASRFNKGLVEAVKDLPDLTIHHLYSNYPDFKINVKKEQELLIANDVIIVQHPFQWYSCPPLLKLWIDMALAYGFAYGEGGTALRGKEWMSAITTGARGIDYRSGGAAGYTISELIRPIQQTVWYCSMIWKPVFAVHGTGPAEPEEQKKIALEDGCKRYKELLLSM